MFETANHIDSILRVTVKYAYEWEKGIISKYE